MGSNASKSRALFAFALFLGTEVRIAHAAAPTIYNLGTLPGGPDSVGYGVNASGQVTGWSVTSPDSVPHAFLYTGTPGSGGVMHDLGALTTAGFPESYGHGINASGQVAGWTATPGPSYAAFRYTGTPGSGGTMVSLGTLISGSRSVGFAINDAGHVAGAGSYHDVAAHAFLYTGTPGSGGVMHDLGTLGGWDSYGYAINAGGQVAGYSTTLDDTAPHAFRYTGTPGSGGAMADLGTLGGTDSWGYAINASGQVAGYSNPTGDAARHAFLYTGTPGSGGVMQDLGTLGGTNSEGYAINAGGQVAGWSGTTGNAAQHAFLYTGTPGVDGDMLDLDAWLDANNPTEGAKWTLVSANGLSNNGLVTGDGNYNDGVGGLSDGRRAFILDGSALVPEPSSLAMLTLAAAALLRRRRRRP